MRSTLFNAIVAASALAAYYRTAIRKELLVIDERGDDVTCIWFA